MPNFEGTSAAYAECDAIAEAHVPTLSEAAAPLIEWSTHWPDVPDALPAVIILGGFEWRIVPMGVLRAIVRALEAGK